MSLERYNRDLAVRPFGLQNTGVICHFNALLQALVGCTSFVRAVLTHRAHLAKTPTGRALFDFVYEACAHGGAHASRAALFGARAPVGAHSARVLAALTEDLRARRSWTTFTSNHQESSSEGLTLLLDMLDDPDEESAPDGQTLPPNPVARLFYHRSRDTTFCGSCKKKVCESTSDGVQFDLFDIYDRRPPATPQAFADLLANHSTPLTGYKCEQCGCSSGGARVYNLRFAPEIIVTLFNQYYSHQSRYVPPGFVLSGKSADIAYIQVAQVEHSGGGRDSGHYTARSLRKDAVYRFNDSSASKSAFERSAGTYLVFFHAA